MVQSTSPNRWILHVRKCLWYLPCTVGLFGEVLCRQLIIKGYRFGKLDRKQITLFNCCSKLCQNIPLILCSGLFFTEIGCQHFCSSLCWNGMFFVRGAVKLKQKPSSILLIPLFISHCFVVVFWSELVDWFESVFPFCSIHSSFSQTPQQGSDGPSACCPCSVFMKKGINVTSAPVTTPTLTLPV